MRIILLGAPGAGKGSVAKILTDLDGSVQISTGDILRQAVKEETKYGKKAKEYMERGDLVPHSVIMEIMEARLRESDCKKGFILDGFPRTIAQAEELKTIIDRLSISLDLVVNLEVPVDIILERLETRRTCSNPSCQEIYNIKRNPPAAGGKCKKCDHPVIQRADETKEAICIRLETYNSKTAPLIDYYQKEGLLKSVLSLTLPETITAIKTELNNLNDHQQ